MAYYRLYHLDTTGHFKHVEEFHCDDDHAAIVRAQRTVSEHGVELWSAGRKIVHDPTVALAAEAARAKLLRWRTGAI